jgi:aspartyl-tRNA(Asn)/glutamyl-tRNA(Gln) amidotransferase subunit A
VKDNICTSFLPTTAGSSSLKNFKSPYDATVVGRLKNSGAIICGKTNLDEFGMGSHSTHSHFGPVWQTLRGDATPRSAGGSSGGSALAVKTEQCIAAIGTDTGGSVRLPAAYTNCVGFKPSYGLISRWGVIAYANSLDTVGILGSDVAIVETVFDVLDAYDEHDPTSLPPRARARIQEEARRLQAHEKGKPWRIGVPLEYNIAELQSEVRSYWQKTLSTLQDIGHVLVPVSLPSTRHALSAYYIIAPAEASSNLAKYDGVRYGSREPGPDAQGDEHVLYAKTRGAGFGDEVKRRILLGSYSLSAEARDNYFLQAQRVRRWVQMDFNSVFAAPHPLLEAPRATPTSSREDQGVDFLVCPTAPSTPPTLDEVANQDPVQTYMNDVFTVPASLAGLPAVSVGSSAYAVDKSNEGIGIQVIGQYGHDSLVLRAASTIQEMLS